MLFVCRSWRRSTRRWFIASKDPAGRIASFTRKRSTSNISIKNMSRNISNNGTNVLTTRTSPTTTNRDSSSSTRRTASVSYTHLTLPTIYSV